MAHPIVPQLGKQRRDLKQTDAAAKKRRSHSNVYSIKSD